MKPHDFIYHQAGKNKFPHAKQKIVCTRAKEAIALNWLTELDMLSTCSKSPYSTAKFAAQLCNVICCLSIHVDTNNTKVLLALISDNHGFNNLRLAKRRKRAPRGSFLTWGLYLSVEHQINLALIGSQTCKFTIILVYSTVFSLLSSAQRSFYKVNKG